MQSRRDYRSAVVERSRNIKNITSPKLQAVGGALSLSKCLQPINKRVAFLPACTDDTFFYRARMPNGIQIIKIIFLDYLIQLFENKKKL